MAMPQNTQPSSPAPAPTKSNAWLIVIIILVILAILWPILRRGKSNGSEVSPTDSALTSTTTVFDMVSDDTEAADLAVAEGASESESMTVRAYFGSKKNDPASARCDLVYPVARTVARTSAVGRAALAALLAGPTAAEAAAGVFTSINSGVKLQSLTIAAGVARADFSQELGTEVGGACLVTAIRAQITETLKQFPTIKSVSISINGVSVGILEP